jgi:hypothetical protein
MRVGLILAALLAAGAATARPRGDVVRVDHYDSQTAPSKGRANAPVTVEMFFAPSTNNTVQLRALRQLEALQQKHPTRVRLVYRIIQRSAQPPGPQLPTLALEAFAQGKFFELLAAVNAELVNLTREKLLEVARKVGVDATRAERAIADDRYREVLDGNEARIERLRGATAPIVFFNARPMRSSLGSTSDTDYENA